MATPTVRPNQNFNAKATITRGDSRLVSWIIFNGHNSDSGNILQFFPKNGLELDYSFTNEGKFRLAAYNKEIQTKEDFQATPELKHVDVIVTYNSLDGNKLVPKGGGNFVSGTSLRKNFPAVFEAKFVINPSSDEISRLRFYLTDGAGNALSDGLQTQNSFTFTPNNSSGKYIVTAEYTNEAGIVTKQTFTGETKSLSVKDITHASQVVRPGTPMSFSITKTQFGSVANDADLPDGSEIKWNLNKVLIGRGRTINIPGASLLEKKKYHIEAYGTSPIGRTTGTNEDDVKNDWHFEVKDNIVESIKLNGSAKLGRKVEFEIEKMTFPNYDRSKDGSVSWEISGPENIRIPSEAKLTHQFSVAGKYQIDCVMGGRKSAKPLVINVVQPKILVDTAKWIDNDDGKSGNIIKRAGYNQEVCAFVKYEGLEKEEATLEVYDDDSTGDNIVYSSTAILPDTAGVYWPFLLNEEVKKKIEEKGLTKPGELYFKIKPTDANLKVENGDEPLGKSLLVNSDPKIIEAYFCDANDTEKLTISSLSKALYFKIYATNMVDKKVEVNFATESDPYFSWDNTLSLQNWDEIKDKFKNEKIRDIKPATFNNKGEVLVPVDLAKFGTPKNFILLNALVKVIDEPKEGEPRKEEQGFYMINYNLARLFPDATLPNVAENNGAVKVGRENLSGGGNHSESKCPRCEEKITVQQLNDTVGDTADQDYRKRIVDYLNKFIEERKGKSNELHLNTCLLKAHFVSQISTETGLLKIKLTEGNTPPYYSKDNIKGLWPSKYQEMVKDGTLESVSSERPQKKLLNYVYGRKNGNKGGEDGWNYRGKGLIQLTGRDNYSDASTFLKEVFPDKYVDFEENNEKPGEEMYAVLSAIAFWEGKKVYDVAKDKKDVSGVPDVRTIINKHDRENIHAQTYFKNAVKAFKVNDCTPVDLNAKDIITYRIYWNNDETGKIEKHIPKIIKEEYKNQFKYVYHDIKGKEHVICIVDWIDADKRANGSTVYSIPKGYVKTYDYPAGGNAQKAYEYSNGDIYVTGTQYGKRKYPKDRGKVKLVRMKDSLSYEKDEIKVYYSFRSSQRRYCNPDAYAGFIGALAEINRKDVLCTGMCFGDATSYPSVTHPNGDSADTAYFSTLKEEQIKVNAFKKFNFRHIYRGNGGWFSELKGTEYSSGHEDHLHSGEFNSSIIEIIEEK